MPKTELKYSEVKTIKLTPDQVKKWDQKAIRAFLDRNTSVDTTLLKQLFTLMDAKMSFTQTPSPEDIALIKKVSEAL